MKYLKVQVWTPSEQLPELYIPILFHVSFLVHAGAYIGNNKWRVNNSYQDQEYHTKDVKWWAVNDIREEHFTYEN